MWCITCIFSCSLLPFCSESAPFSSVAVYISVCWDRGEISSPYIYSERSWTLQLWPLSSQVDIHWSIGGRVSSFSLAWWYRHCNNLLIHKYSLISMMPCLCFSRDKDCLMIVQYYWYPYMRLEPTTRPVIACTILFQTDEYISLVRPGVFCVIKVWI